MALEDSFAELDKLNSNEKEQASGQKPEEAKIVTKPEEEEKPEETTETKPEEEKPAEEVKPPQEEVPKTNQQLRKAYEERKKEIRVKNDEINRLKTELEKIKSNPPPDVQEKQVMLQRLTKSEQRVKELEDEMRFTNYAKSSEFVDQYEKPYVEAWQKAASDLAEITVESEDGNSRQATVHDLQMIAQLPLSKAREVAKQMFGDSAEEVMAHRRIIKDLADKQGKALEEARTKGAEREKENQVRMAQQREAANRMWGETNAQLEQKYPQWFGHPEDDAEGNAIYDKAREQIDAFMFSRSEQLPPDQLVKFHSLVRAKFANHDRLALHLKKMREENAELKKTIEQYEKSEPPAGKSAKSAPKPAKSFMDDSYAELESLNKKI